MKNRKQIRYMILLMFMISAVTLTACKQEEKPEEEPEQVPLQEYEEPDSEPESEYDHLEKTQLTSNDMTEAVYVIKEGEQIILDNAATSSLAGVSMSSLLQCFTGQDQIIEPGDALLNEFVDQYAVLENDQEVEDIQVFDAVTGENYMLQQISYNRHTAGNVIYPCVIYIKVDTVAANAYITNVVAVDNSKADESTADILAEVLDAYGIAIESGDESE